VQLTLTVRYTDRYPDELPDFSLEAIEGELEDDELQSLSDELCTVVCRQLKPILLLLIEQSQGEENLGMAMTFTLVSHLREQLSSLVRIRAENVTKAEMEKERLALEVLNIEL
jgi:hypothetical protein